MKPINTYLNGLFGNLGIDGNAIAKDDIERLQKIYSGPKPEYNAENAGLVVKYQFDHPYIVFEINKPLPDAGVNSIEFVNKNSAPISQYTFTIGRNCDYPGRLLDKMVFPKDVDMSFTCYNSFKIDDDVYKDSKFADRTPSLTISDEESNHAVLDLSDFTRPLGRLRIFDFENIKFNQKQKIKELQFKLVQSIPHINTLPDCDTLTIDVTYLGRSGVKILPSMFDDFTPSKNKPKKINFIGNITPLVKLQIKNIINEINK